MREGYILNKKYLILTKNNSVVLYFTLLYFNCQFLRKPMGQILEYFQPITEKLNNDE